MAQPTDNQRERNSAWQWLVNGWHSLRDKAMSAMTYFTPEREQEQSAQRWGVLASDVTERKNTVHVELELPGLEKADLNVAVHDNQLLVSGEKRTSATRQKNTLVITERAFGRFKRVILLPCNVASEGTRAYYENGVLSVDMPKEQANRVHSIPIRQA